MSDRRIGLSYWRYSEKKQSKGDSEERQERDFRTFCTHHNLTPVSGIYADRGRSGYKDEHRKKGRLGQLLADARAKRIEPGTVIVVEAWDRLGRLRPDRQTELIAELLKTGVSIGVCRLNDIFTEDDFGTHKWAILSTFIMLAYQESKQKADRVASSWKTRREKAREHGWKIPGRVPTWLRLEGGRFVLIPKAVAAVKRVFTLSAAGYGKRRICAALTAEKVAPMGKSGVWHDDFIDMLLNDRRAVGEYQPRKADKSPAGDVIENYYPAVVTPEEFALARAGQEGRKKKSRPRDRKYVNVFRGMLVNATDGEGFALLNYGTEKKSRLCLSSTAGLDGRTQTQTFPYGVFEEAILGQLAEVNPADVLPKSADETSRADVLRTRLAKLRADRIGLKEDLSRGYDRHLADLLRSCGAEEEKAAADLQEELARNARPAERAWGELPSLVSLVKSEGDDARLRVRTLLRSIVAEARLLLVRRRSRIIAVAQFYFVGGAVRNYLVLYQSAAYRRPKAWHCRSLASVVQAGDLDLRQRDHADRLTAVLEAIDLKPLTEGEVQG